MKTPIRIPLVHLGKLPDAMLPDDHPDLRGSRGLARDAGIPIEEAQAILDILLSEYDACQKRQEGR
jgi:hypothetical protein